MPVILLVLILWGRVPAWSQASRDTTLIIYFREDAYQPEGPELNKLDSFLSSNKDARILRIEGHTDTVGTSAYNIQLSRKRSGAISRYLRTHWGQLGKSRGEYPVLNYGEERPADLHDNALNRRVVIILEAGGERENVAVTKKTGDSVGPGERAEVMIDSVADEARGAEKKDSAGTILKRYRLDKLYFKPDIAVLESFSLAYIHSMAQILKGYTKDEVFEIRGHVNCPLSVPPGTNFMKVMNQLSVDRAKLVYRLLTEEGIPAGRMSYQGMGNTEMIYPHARTEEEMRKNMRVEIFVIQTSSSKPLLQ